MDATSGWIVAAACALAAIGFIALCHVYQESTQPFLKGKFFTFPGAHVDLWSLGHFLLYVIFGFFVPERHLTFFVIGGTFELIEDYMASNELTQLAKCTSKDRFWCKGAEDGYHYMNPTDPWVNLTGYVVGSAVRTTFWRPDP